MTFDETVKSYREARERVRVAEKGVRDAQASRATAAEAEQRAWDELEAASKADELISKILPALAAEEGGLRYDPKLQRPAVLHRKAAE